MCEMPTSIAIRDALPEEAELLSNLAQRSKAHWGYSRQFMEACIAELTYQPDVIEDDNFNFVLAEMGSEIVGFYATKRLSQSQYEMEALFVEPQHIGLGIGRELIENSLAHISKNRGTTLLVQGDPNSEDFYLAIGGRQVGSRESGSIPGRFLPLFEISA